MFRPGRNPKDQQTTQTDDTADHTPQTSSTGYGSSYGSGSPTSGTTATEAYQQSVHTPTAGRAVTESESLARDIKEGTLTGFVGNGTTLQGEANFKGMLRVDGHLSGRVSSADGTLIVSTNGQVDANVEVAIAQIYGTVNGDIVASKRIEMGRVAKVTGNIQTPALVIEQGALFEGSCRMSQQMEALNKQERKEETAVAASSTAATSSSSTSSPSTPSSSSYKGSSSSTSGKTSTSSSDASAGVAASSDITS